MLDFAPVATHSDPAPLMSTPLAVLLVLVVGGVLTFAATRATGSVAQGRTFLKWMLTVFVVYVVLITLPVLIGF